jgi:uncharacterized protein (TIGR02246 family)
MQVDQQQTLARIAADLEQAWNAADGEAFARRFTEDADFVNIRGEHFRTRPVIAAGHQAIFDSIYRGSVVRYEPAGVRLLSSSVLVGQIRGKLRAPSGPLAGEHDALATLVLVEEGDGWRIAVFHNTLVAGK